MTDSETSNRSDILKRLAESRQEIRTLLEPPLQEAGTNGLGGEHTGGFPRSRTMQMLMSGKGMGTLGAVASGLLIAKPALALRLLRLLPASAMARTLLVRAFTTWRAKQQ
jgi:hypothetical protein